MDDSQTSTERRSFGTMVSAPSQLRTTSIVEVLIVANRSMSVKFDQSIGAVNSAKAAAMKVYLNIALS